jgi:hypothetical protein
MQQSRHVSRNCPTAVRANQAWTLLLAQSAGKQEIQQAEEAQQQLARLLLTRWQQAAGRGQVLHRRQMQTQQTGATAVQTASSGSSSTADVLGQQLGTQVQQIQVMWL